jgi:hypothetical protein
VVLFGVALGVAAGPLGRVKLPFRLHTQVHGWWEPEEGYLSSPKASSTLPGAPPSRG